MMTVYSRVLSSPLCDMEVSIGNYFTVRAQSPQFPGGASSPIALARLGELPHEVAVGGPGTPWHEALDSRANRVGRPTSRTCAPPHG
jgi:hypothetical protein